MAANLSNIRRSDAAFSIAASHESNPRSVKTLPPLGVMCMDLVSALMNSDLEMVMYMVLMSMNIVNMTIVNVQIMEMYVIGLMIMGFYIRRQS